MNPCPDIHFQELLVGCIRIHAVGKKYIDQVIFGVSPDIGTGKSGMAKAFPGSASYKRDHRESMSLMACRIPVRGGFCQPGNEPW